MSNSEKKVILTIDDQEYVRSSIRNFLEDYDYSIIEAENGRIGLDIFERERPDLLLVDLCMPEVDGLEVLKKVREDSPETPIVIVSGTGVLRDVVEALRLGAWDYILKPIQDMEVLLHVVRKSLEKARLVQENIRYQQHLEEMVEQRTSELNKTNKELLAEIEERKRVEQQREELLKILASKNEELESIVYVSSHDLKTPLVNIGGFSSMLTQHCGQLEELVERADICDDIRKEIIPLIEENIPEDLKFICSGSSRMNTLIDGLLRVSRIGTSDLKHEEIDMNKMVTEITNTIKYQTDEAGATITIDRLPDCRGDLSQTNHVFSNLIDNALKYLDPERKGIIRISARVTGNKSVYCIEDNGIGIEQAYEGKIFEIYHRLEPDGPVAGEGLGLTIARRVLDRADGEIWMESEVGKGSRFFVSLPCC